MTFKSNTNKDFKPTYTPNPKGFYFSKILNFWTHRVLLFTKDKQGQVYESGHFYVDHYKKVQQAKFHGAKTTNSCRS